jgi:hypothetical protein
MWSRKTRFDFYWPAFAHLGEQAVLNKEIYYNADADDDKVFGYQNKGRFGRNSNNSIKGGLVLNKTKTQRRAGTKKLREMPSVKTLLCITVVLLVLLFLLV